MFIRFIFVPHLEDTYLNLGPDIMALCSREFVINVLTNSTTITYEQIYGSTFMIDTTDPFNPIINIEQVQGKFGLKAYGDDEVTDTLEILSGPIDTLNRISITTMTGLNPVTIPIKGIYVQKINEFFRWKDEGVKLKWGASSFLPNLVTNIRVEKLSDSSLILNMPVDTIGMINTRETFKLIVQYNIGGNISYRSGGNWFFANNAQVDERQILNININTKGSGNRNIYTKTLLSYKDSPNNINVVDRYFSYRANYKNSKQFRSSQTVDMLLTTKTYSKRTIYTDRIIA